VKICYDPIGFIKTPFKEPKGTPIQPTAAKGIRATIELKEEYSTALQDLAGFSHIILLYHFHLSKEPSLVIEPFLDGKKHGVFACRAPSRPNPIGISIVRLIEIDANKITIEDVDILDGTPLLDIKPYVEDFDKRDNTRSGWLEGQIGRHHQVVDDGRFMKKHE